MTAPAVRPARSRTTESAWDLLEVLPAQLATIDECGVVAEANRAWREFGLAPVGARLLDGWSDDATGPLVRSTLELGVRELLSGARERFELEYPFRGHGESVWLELQAHRRPRGGALLSQVDVTPRRRAEELRAREHAEARSELFGRLGETNRLQSEFVSVVSHELRTPIHVVLGFTDLLLEGELGSINEGQRDALNRILFGARSLLELSEAALQLTRLEAEPPSRVEDFEVRELAREAEAEARGAHRGSAVPIELRLAAGLTRVRSDRGKMKVVLKNLLHNALKFTRQGTVTLSVRTRGDDVVFAVIDTGVGIPEEALATIFDPFRQADGSSTRPFGGVGLGLHVVRCLTERLGGSVRISSQVGRGTQVEVAVPSRRDAPDAD